jgi:hypothetical protein
MRELHCTDKKCTGNKLKNSRSNKPNKRTVMPKNEIKGVSNSERRVRDMACMGNK